ncbi:MAG TPA: glycosyltransferase family 2 protein [Phycisphaerae bacterium]|nr:glycosyltransferase family 2 protein [Phycisphaerae bacterium]
MAAQAHNGPPAEAVLLSVVVPVYNELDTWMTLLHRVRGVQLPRGVDLQVVLVDDCSTDGTREQVEAFARKLPPDDGPSPAAVKVMFHQHNQGKGAALRTGFAAADGDILIVQDADLEYDPNDYPALLAPVLAGEAKVVYGSRYLNGRPEQGYLANYLANRFLTGLSNLTTGLGLTDMETCYKVFRREVLADIRIEQNRFGFEPEITAKIARRGIGVREVPIAYRGRRRDEGKKIGWKDGLKAVWCILKYGLFGRKG